MELPAELSVPALVAALEAKSGIAS